MNRVLPAEFASSLALVRRKIQSVDGWLTDREVQFLALAAACPTAAGRVLELGCYHGRSTIVLAVAAQLAGSGEQIFSVDPIAPEAMKANLRTAGVELLVDFHRAYSQEFLQSWRQPIRLLWHDGANRNLEVRQDIALVMPYLADGAIVGFHDCLNTSGERIHPFVDEVLGSDHFGPAGVCGSIGWGQYHKNPLATLPFQAAKRRLIRKLRRVQPYQWLDRRPLGRLGKYRYKLLRFLVPHGAVDPQTWLNQVGGFLTPGASAISAAQRAA